MAFQITMSSASVNGQDVCIAQLPVSLTFTGAGSNKKRTITWTLVTNNLLVEFPTKNGILVVDDANGQINPDNARTDPVTYKAKNKHDAQGDATYVPVILYRTAAGEAPSVCATGDPKVVNN